TDAKFGQTHGGPCRNVKVKARPKKDRPPESAGVAGPVAARCRTKKAAPPGLQLSDRCPSTPDMQRAAYKNVQIAGRPSVGVNRIVVCHDAPKFGTESIRVIILNDSAIIFINTNLHLTIVEALRPHHCGGGTMLRTI